MDSNELYILKVLPFQKFIPKPKNNMQFSFSGYSHWAKLASTNNWSRNDYLTLSNSLNNYEQVYLLKDDKQKLNFVTAQEYQSKRYITGIQLSEKYNKILIQIKSNSFLNNIVRLHTLQR
jgi:tRNA U38,U39,U40 pseudouridine synthase TruA